MQKQKSINEELLLVKIRIAGAIVATAIMFISIGAQIYAGYTGTSEWKTPPELYLFYFAVLGFIQHKYLIAWLNKKLGILEKERPCKYQDFNQCVLDEISELSKLKQEKESNEDKLKLS